MVAYLSLQVLGAEGENAHTCERLVEEDRRAYNGIAREARRLLKEHPGRDRAGLGHRLWEKAQAMAVSQARRRRLGLWPMHQDATARVCEALAARGGVALRSREDEEATCRCIAGWRGPADVMRGKDGVIVVAMDGIGHLVTEGREEGVEDLPIHTVRLVEETPPAEAGTGRWETRRWRLDLYIDVEALGARTPRAGAESGALVVA